MTEKEIAERIGKLTEEQRNGLYCLCEQRKRKNKNGADVAVYEGVSADVAKALQQQDLIWLIGSKSAATRHHVYKYWENHIYSRELQPAD